MGLYYGNHMGVSRYYVQALLEWQDNQAPDTISPHVMLIICNGTTAKDEELLFSELGPLAQAIQNRLGQPEFEKRSLFPVCYKKLYSGAYAEYHHIGPGHLVLRSATWTSPSG